MITLVKLGGSLITDKTQRATFRPKVMHRLAHELQSVLEKKTDAKIIIGHGSGSFGHFEAKEHGTASGVHTQAEWYGFAKVANIAAELNFRVAQSLQDADVPVFRFQPSASVISEKAKINAMALRPIQYALDHGLIPLVYGDVAFDTSLGGTITSTETIFRYLTEELPVSRILLLGEVDGVFDAQQQVIPHITPANFEDIRHALGQSGGVDVTGGMLTKVEDMLHLATNPPHPTIQIINGKRPGMLHDTLSGDLSTGTRITN